MKLGCSSWSYHRDIHAGKLDQQRWLILCAEELELDGVELLDLHFPSTDVEYLREVRRTCADLQLTISCVSVSNDFGSADAEAREQQLTKVKEWVEIAAYLGAPSLRVFAGWLPADQEPREGGGGALARLGRVLRRKPDYKRRHWPELIAKLRACADYAAQRGVVLGLENHNGRGLVGTADEVERCLQDVDSRWLRLNLDTGDYGDLASIERTLRHVVHVHAKLYDLDSDGADQRFDWPAIMRILRQARYRGFLSIEYEGEEDATTAVPRGVRYLRGLLREEQSAG